MAAKKRDEIPGPNSEALYRISRKAGGLLVEEVRAVVEPGSARVLAHDVFDVAIAKLHASVRKRCGL
jgi:hypothetical protein